MCTVFTLVPSIHFLLLIQGHPIHPSLQEHFQLLLRVSRGSALYPVVSSEFGVPGNLK